MTSNPETLAMTAFGAALMLGLMGAPLWIAISVAAIYGFDGYIGQYQSTADRSSGEAVRAIPGARVGLVILAYATALALRLLGEG